MRQTLATLFHLPERVQPLDFFAPLLLRLYLAPVFWMAGMNKLNAFESTAQWFGNPDWGLGLPFPYLMAALATGAEVLGALALLFGLLVRWATIPLMITMLVAVFSVHWKNGWQAIADPMMCLFNCADAQTAISRLDRARDILRENANYSWLTEHGNFAIINNGIEFAATYFIMLLALFFMGAGRYLSVDHWLSRALGRGPTTA